MSNNSKLASPNNSTRNLSPWIFWGIFLLVVVLVALGMALESQPLVPKSLPVFKSRVLTYHLITQSDLTMKAFNLNDGSADTVSDMSKLIGHYTLGTIDANKPIDKSQIGLKLDTVRQKLLSNPLVAAIPADGTTTLGGTVHAGDIVSVAAVPLAGPPLVISPQALVLDVKTVENQTVIILAIPSETWSDYLTKTRDATIMLSYQVG